jgi:putative nucleotidyltransferase with HDIG domain
MAGVEQNRYHHRDVAGHTLEVLERVIELEADPGALLGEEHAAGVRALLSAPLADELTRGEALRFGALLHDVAKPPTRRVGEDGRVLFRAHDELGAVMARAILGRLRASERLQAHVAGLVRHHLRLGFLVAEAPVGRRSTYRYLDAGDAVAADVTLLSVADRLATRGVRSDVAIARHLEVARAMIGPALAWHARGRPAPLVRGDRLARELGLDPGPGLGALLARLAEAQFAGEATTPEEVVDLARMLVGETTAEAAMQADRVAIITGASQGLGLALARALAGRGWRLVIDARRAGALAEAERELAATTTVEAIAGDVADPDHRAELVAAAVRLGRLDALVNNASLLGPSPQPELAAYPADVLRRVYEVNVLAPLALIQDSLELLARTGGRVVNLTSDAAVEAYPGWGGYGSAKAAFEQLTAVLAAEHPDLRIYAVDPGDMRTEMHQDAFPGEDISDRADPADRAPALVELIEGERPSGRYAAGDLLAEAAARDPECLFCRIVAGELPATVIHADERTVAFMDIQPATRGHALVVPRTHARDLEAIGAADLAACAATAQRVAGWALARLGADGVNLLNSCRAPAWQTVFHFHVHVIPRYAGDPLRLPWTPGPGQEAEIAAAGAALRG